MVEVAGKYGKKPAQIALAWLLNRAEVTAPIVGVSKIEQLDELSEATEIVIDQVDMDYLEALYTPVDNLLSIGTS